MPYPNEHSARVQNPDLFIEDSFRRKQIAPGISVILGKKEADGSMEVQSYRFDKDKFTVDEAKDWLREHHITYTLFEPASGEEKRAKALNYLRIKVKMRDGVNMVVREISTKSTRGYGEYDSVVLRVLGLPFGGPFEGRDADGETFHKNTDIWLQPGDIVPITYYHGFGPDDPDEVQPVPVMIGKAKYIGQNEKGFMFEARLDSKEELAQRILREPAKARASSGAISHLVRTGRAGIINVWPVGELALFDTNDWRQPANDYAVVEVVNGSGIEANAEMRLKENNLKEGNKMNEQINIKSDEQTIEPIAEPEDKIESVESVAEAEKSTVDLSPVFEELKSLRELISAPPKKVGAVIEAPSIKKVTGLGFTDDEMKSFMHWIKTGDIKAYAGASKAALQEGTATEGGYLVPDDFYAQIVSKRNEVSVARNAGARVIPTSRDVIQVPVEGTQASFSITSEEGAYSESEPMFSQVSITIYKSTLLIKVSEELLADNATNLESWLSKMIGDRWGVHENAYTIAGSGSSQPQGVLVGGTAGLTFDDTNSISASEIPELFYKLKEQYMAGASWCMQSATMGYLMGLVGNQFQLFSPPAGPGNPWMLWGKPVFPSSSMEAYSITGKKSLLVGDWNMYGLGERQGLVISRNPYLYQANGQVGFFCSVRWGGAVLQAEAFQYGTQL